MKKIILSISAIMITAALLFTSCGSTSPLSALTEGSDFVSIKIIGSDGTAILEESYSMNGEVTVFELTKHATVKNKVSLDYSGAGAAVYVKGIAGVYEFSEGAKSGWLYSVNGDFSLSGKSSGAAKLKSGDAVTWQFTKDLGKDVGADEFGQ